MVGTRGVEKAKILFVITEDWYFWSHRLSLARAARDAGYQVALATHVDQHGDLIRREGIQVLPISLRRSSKSPLRELLAVVELTRLYAVERPDIVHHVALKPVIYGSLAARLARIPAVVNALAGLGFVFIARGRKAEVLQTLMRSAYKLSLSSRNAKVIFQNHDDLAAFVDTGVVGARDVVLIRGSGVDVSTFAPVAEPSRDPVVVLASRMLWDKGVGEYVSAARLLRDAGVRARFVLVGETDPANPAAVSPRQLEEWKESGVVEWWGRRDDMPRVLAESNVVCLPSYREGLPKVLVEAAACGRAIVATDVPGCREIVRPGENGFLVPVRDEKALADALLRLIEDPALRARMGAKGRAIALGEFTEAAVVGQTLSVYRELLQRAGRAA